METENFELLLEQLIELSEKGMPEPYEKVLQDIMDRDYQDTHRAASPLRPAEDAVRLDTSDLTVDESVAAIERLADEAVAAKNH